MVEKERTAREEAFARYSFNTLSQFKNVKTDSHGKNKTYFYEVMIS